MRNNDNKGMEEDVPVAMQLITGIWRVSKMGHLIVPVGLVLLFLFFSSIYCLVQFTNTLVGLQFWAFV